MKPVGGILHPKSFRIGGVIVEVVARCKLTDAQASKIARMFVSQTKIKKSDAGKVFRTVTLFDEDSVTLL